MPEPEVVVVAREWLEFAEQDQRLARAGNGQRELFYPRQVCFEAQQAVEKAIKALCVLHEVDFPFTHDLVKLMQLLADVEAVHAPAADLEWLTQWATSARYPGGTEASWADAERAVAIADDVVTAARATLPAP